MLLVLVGLENDGGKPADRKRNIVTSLELQSEKMEIINKRLQEKYKALEENEVRYEEIGCDDADYVIVAFGSSARICSATVEMARAEGLSKSRCSMTNHFTMR